MDCRAESGLVCGPWRNGVISGEFASPELPFWRRWPVCPRRVRYWPATAATMGSKGPRPLAESSGEKRATRKEEMRNSQHFGP